MKKLVAALSLLTFLALSAPAMANHPWSTYHWARTISPFTVKLGTNVNGTWLPYLQAASSDAANNDWSDDLLGNPVRTTLVAKGASTPKKCSPVSGRVEVCNATYGRNGWLGLASIWLSGGHITQGTAKMNDSYHNYSPYSSPEWRAHVLCQEVGHTFGLGHQDESGADFHTCMDYVDVPHEHSKYPNGHDYEQLALNYGSRHGSSSFDGTTTLKSTQATRGEAPYRIDRRDTRRHTEIVEHFSDGSTKITDILWAIER